MYEEVQAFAEETSDQPVQLELCGISFCDGTYRIARNNTPLYVFEYVIKGTGTVVVDGKSYTASAGDVYIIPEGSDHCYYSDEANPWIKIFFNVRGRLVRQLVHLYGLAGHVVMPGGDLLPLFLQLYETAKSSPVHNDIIAPCTLKMHEIVQRLSALVWEQPVDEEALRIKAMLDSHLYGEITLDEVAAAVFCSKDHVIKQFKRAFGETPHAYFLRRKMALAQSLLTGTKLPIGQVASTLGYVDFHYFSNVFKKVTGVSPLEYRRGG